MGARKRLVTILALLIGSEALAGNPTFFALNYQSTALAITTAAQSLSTWTCSGALTIQTDRGSSPHNVTGSILTVSLGALSNLTYYSDPACTTVVTSASIALGTSQTTVYFNGALAGTYAIQASAAGYKPVTQNETLSSNAYTWVGGGGDANWNTPANWYGGSAPGGGNTAIFDATCTANCSATINVSPNIGGIIIGAGYSSSKTITQSSTNTITLGAAGWTQAGGTFAGGSGAIAISGPFTLSGGSFTATSGTLTVTGNYALTGSPTFSANSGTLALSQGGNTSLTVGGETYKNVTFNTIARTTTLTGTMNISGTLTGNCSSSTSCVFNGGTLNALGNVNLSSFGLANSGTTVLQIGGSSNQTITGSSLSQAIPNLTIASTGGTVTYSGTFSVPFNYIVSSGTLSTTGSTLGLGGDGAATSWTFGSETYDNVTIENNSSTTITISGTLTVNGTLTAQTQASTTSIIGGTIVANGNVSLSNNGLTPYAGTTTVLKIAGSSNQTISATGSNATIPNLTIASTGGTVSLSGTIGVNKNYTFTSGTLSAGTSTLEFYATVSITVGSETYNNVTFASGSSGTMTVSGTLNIAGTLTGNMVGCCSTNNGGILAVQGDVVLSGTGLGTGTTQVQMVGPSSSNLTGVAGNLPGSVLTVNKTGGAGITLEAAVNVNASGQSLSLTSGSINMNGNGLTIKNALSLSSGTSITRNGGTLTVNGVTVGAGSYGSGTIN